MALPTPLSIRGGWYTAALPDGSYVSLVTDSHFQLKDRVVGLNGQNLLFLDSWGPLTFAGSGHKDDQGWKYVNGAWSSHGLAYGPFSVIFDAIGTLVVKHDPPPSGYRYVADNGALVSASSTYADPARGIWEYTTYGATTFGQGGQGAYGDDPLVVITPDGKKRLICEGRCRAIRVKHAPNNTSFALGWSQEDRQEGRALWLTAAQLLTLPVITSTPPIPPDPPMPIPNHLDVVKKWRATYANLPAGGARAGKIVNGVAWELRGEGCGTFYKPSGMNYNDRSIDVVIYKSRPGDPAGKGATFDILSDAEGKAEPEWNRTKPSGFGDVEKWRPATDPLVPSPEPPEPPPDDQELKTLVAKAQLQHRQLGQTLDQIAAALED
jgi:hypothetical protein